MNKRGKVAIITRTKDRPVFLRRAMQSVLGQRYGDWVHVVVNDGGERGAVEILAAAYEEAYAGRLVLVHHGESLGMQNASNAGIAASASEYVVIHDDDDSWERDFLELTVDYLDRAGPGSEYQGVVTQTTQVFEEVETDGTIRELRRKPYHPFAFVNLTEMRNRNVFAPICFVYRRSVHDRIGGFRQEFDVLGDHDFNLRFLRHWEIGVLETFAANYHWRHRAHGNTVTRGRDRHRVMLNRLKNRYYRESLEDPVNGVGHLDGIPIPPPGGLDPVPLKVRSAESALPEELGDLRERYDFEILSLDVFDTVLRRRVAHPKDVFREVEWRAGEPGRGYALAREEAEQQARRRAGGEVEESAIFECLGEILGLGEEAVERLCGLEREVEEAVLYGDPRWVEWIRRYREAGVRVVFVSDMYVSSEWIGELLERCGVEAPEVVVSCEEGVSKAEGALQRRLTERWGVKPEAVLHVGDNFRSDYVRSLQAGWQALHWSEVYQYRPWFREADPFYHEPSDRLSPWMMAKVEELGLREGLPEACGLLHKLGREVAGPLYWSYMNWVLEQARADGVKKLLLVGRDGYYWEKTLQVMARERDLGVEFRYIHSSRKVFNFASFRELDETAMEFLLTPNPSLRVKDFLTRAGLEAGRYEAHMARAGFPDAEAVLTNEMGGRYLESSYKPRMRVLMELLEPELKEQFELDRRGVLATLEAAEFDPADSALVDIGWNGSTLRPVARLWEGKAESPVLGYFFGTWKEALAARERVKMKGYFIEFGEPEEHFQLVRECVNLLEAVNAAPYATLLSFREGAGGEVEPIFSEKLVTGFPVESQERIWAGAEEFVAAMLEESLPEVGRKGGHVYLNLVLDRLLREPSPAEVKAFGSLLHSDGFGLEVYQRLIEPLPETVNGESLVKAYRSSSWKRGFLAGLAENQRGVVLQRVEAEKPKGREELEADLKFKINQAEEFWKEKERYKWQANHFRGEADRLKERVDKLEGDLRWKTQQADEIWAEKARFQGEKEAAEAALAEANRRSHEELEETRRRAEEVLAARESELAAVKEELEGKLAARERALGEAEAILGRRLELLKIILGKRAPGWGARERDQG